MIDYEIKKALSSYNKFLGCFARDKIPSIVEYPSFIIVNTDKSSDRGTHWVAMRFTARECEYFDSFGLPPLHQEMINAVGSRKMLWNGRCLQHPSSRTCGEFCIAFVKLRSLHFSFIRFIKYFSSDTKSNDKKVKSISADEWDINCQLHNENE